MSLAPSLATLPCVPGIFIGQLRFKQAVALALCGLTTLGRVWILRRAPTEPLAPEPADAP
ncbi:hypothetical protein [Ottowia sp.]|uniref:hypothetical protein n=1 Tax=Ottowia sp. TaxID=1898956 RepID=UPI0039E32801